MVSVIVVMAGSGSRMGLNENKVLLPLAGKPVFMYSVDLFTSLGFEVILVIRAEDEAKIREYINKEQIVTYGGKSRSESVFNGLAKASGEVILVHDAARPLISKDVVLECVNVINDNTAAFVGKKAVDTIRQKTKDDYITLNRDSLVYAQTPQGACAKILKYAYNEEKKNGFLSTDEIAVIEKYSKLKIELVIGNDENFKLTTMKDYALAKELVGE